MRAVIRALRPGVPVIHFGTGTADAAAAHARGGRRRDRARLARRPRPRLGRRRPRRRACRATSTRPLLLAPPAVIRERVQAILARAGGRPGHIFNLGHGVLQATPVEHVRALVDMVHELSARCIDAVLLIAFGGPTAPEEIRPFLEIVTRGRRIPPERLEEVAHHYEQMPGGRSPLNELTEAQADGLRRALARRRRAAAGLRRHAQLASVPARDARRDGGARSPPRARHHPVVAPHARRRGSATSPTSPPRASARRARPRSSSRRRGSSTRASSRPSPPASARRWRRSRPASARDTPLVFTAHSIPVAMAAASPVRRRLHGHRARGRGPARPRAAGRSPTRAAAAARAIRGSSPTSAT